jgi:integrase
MARVWIEDRAGHAAYEGALKAYKAKKGGKKQPPARWRVRWYDPSGKQKSQSYIRLPDAENRRDALLADLRDHTYRDPSSGRTKLSTVAEEWFTAKSPSWKPRTKRHYREILDGYVIPKWGDTAVAAIDYGGAATWLAGLHNKPGMSGSAKRKLGASRIQGIYQAMRGVMGWAVKTSRIPENPVKGIDKDTLPSVAGGKHLYLDHTQIAALVDAVGQLDTAYGKPKPMREVYQVMVLTLAYCGLRMGEAIALRVESVDLDAMELHVVEALGVDDDGNPAVGLPKGDKIRVVGIPDFLGMELRVIMSGKDDDDLVFPSPKGDMINAYNWRERIFRPAREEAKLPDEATPHTLRHSFASLSVAAGADVKTLQAAMGHSSATITLDVYTDLFPARVGEVASALGSARALALAA